MSRLPASIADPRPIGGLGFGKGDVKTVNNPLEKTLAVLTETPNETAVPTLLSALDSSDSSIQEGALQALLHRRRSSGQRELVQRWHTLNERWKRIVGQHPRRIASAVRHAILSADHQLCVNGCDALLQTREYELMPTLITAARAADNPQAELAIETLLQLAELLYDEMTGPRDRNRGRDPDRTRHYVIPCLQSAVDRFDLHKRHEIVEAFLLLTTRENPTLKNILRDPRHNAYLTMVDILSRSSRLGIMRLLLNFLEDSSALSTPLQIIARRGDLPFIRLLLGRIGRAPAETIRKNLRKLDSLSWLTENTTVLDTLSESDQQAAVSLATLSGLNRLKAFGVLKHVLQHGHVGARRDAAEALPEFNGADADQLAMQGLDDPDPHVQALMARQLRGRRIPGAIARLIQFLDSPHEVIREAARDSLQEFNFERFLASFDMMDEDIRRSTGKLVLRVDPTVLDRLADELKAPSRTRRMRGLEIANTMQVVDRIEALVIELLGDQDHFIRADAAESLQGCNTALARQALRTAMSDRSAAVREAAEMALQHLAAGPAAPTGTSPIAGVLPDELADPALPTALPPMPEAGV